MLCKGMEGGDKELKKFVFNRMTYGDFEDLVNKCLNSWKENTFVGTIRSVGDEILVVLLVKDEGTANIIRQVMSEGFEAVRKKLILMY